MNELVVVVPTYRRPRALAVVAERFAAATDRIYRILFVIRPDDHPTRRAFERLQKRRPEVDAIEEAGPYRAGVNTGVRASFEPLILIGADDIKPHPGWLAAAKAYMSEKIGYVSLNDLGNHDVMTGRYATLPLVARWYAASEGDLYFQGYTHTGCDVDASLRAQERGAYAYAPDAIMEHLHPAWGKGEVDATYKLGGMNDDVLRADRELLAQRWPEWDG